MPKILTRDQAGFVKRRLLQARQARMTLLEIERELAPVVGHPYHVETAVHLGYEKNSVEAEFAELCRRTGLVVQPNPVVGQTPGRDINIYKEDEDKKGD